ncbi:unnamed protein product [Wuchereria bancrofti]|uniref:Uncharacterized protein n=1 Tax=Wuchereria bancrofti TaxID=6293 RepID=A0A3P7E1S4_WUCBA|nr:unnamed protein product [Wuchereria bancrofti]
MQNKVEVCFQNNRFYWNSPSLVNKNKGQINVPASTLSIGQHHKFNVKNASSKIPISTVGPQHSTSPLLSSSSSSSNATSSNRNSDGNSKLFKFSSNALRF